MRTFPILFTAVAGTVLTTAAHAQRVDQNAVADAKDAFGRSIGGEQIGIYSPDLVRGFSPVVAGNVRIEGLYFDQQTWVTDRLVNSRTVRVGISAQSFPFSAPTGIADYELRKPGKDAVASVSLTYGPFGGNELAIDSQVPLIGEKLGLVAGFSRYRPHEAYGGTGSGEMYAGSVRFNPSKSLDVQAFYARAEERDWEWGSYIFTRGSFLPPRIQRGRFFGQKWAVWEATTQNAGIVARGEWAGFDLALGLFQSEQAPHKSLIDMPRDVDPDGRVGRRMVVGEINNRFVSKSGELRISRTLTEGPRQHAMHLTLRGRALDRRYGGGAVSTSAKVGSARRTSAQNQR